MTKRGVRGNAGRQLEDDVRSMKYAPLFALAEQRPRRGVMAQASTLDNVPIRSMINSTDTPSQSVQSPSQTRWDPFELSPVRLEASRAKGHPMKRGKTTFDPKIFLAKVGEGKTISKYRKDQIVFSQGEVADAVFYIQEGKIKLTV